MSGAGSRQDGGGGAQEAECTVQGTLQCWALCALYTSRRGRGGQGKVSGAGSRQGGRRRHCWLNPRGTEYFGDLHSVPPVQFNLPL